jgi:uncharacterized membrane-anchored protein YjiN (DUF445 family)
MKINEIIKDLNSYLLIVRTKCGKSVKTVIYAISASDARLIANDIWDAKNVQSVTQFTVTATESFVPKRKRRQVKTLTPQDRHTQYQNILTRKYFNALQFPKITDHDKQVALDNAQTQLKRIKLDQERRARGLRV